MTTRSDNSLSGMIIVGLSLFFVYLVWQFSKILGLDMATGFKVIVGLVMFSILLGISLYCSNSYSWELFSLKNTWPVLLGVLWMSFWPALDHWATKTVPPFFHTDDATVWWAAWYTKWGGLLGLVGLGYLVKNMLDE